MPLFHRFVVSGFEWFTASRSVVVKSYLIVKGHIRKSEKKEREREIKRERRGRASASKRSA